MVGLYVIIFAKRFLHIINFIYAKYNFIDL